jgi:hypothetical protein
LPVAFRLELARRFAAINTAAGCPPVLPCPLQTGHECGPGMPIEDIAHLVGHANTRVTELVYRKERLVLTGSGRDGCSLS